MIGAIAGDVIGSVHEYTQAMAAETRKRLAPDLLDVLDRFEERFPARPA